MWLALAQWMQRMTIVAQDQNLSKAHKSDRKVTLFAIVCVVFMVSYRIQWYRYAHFKAYAKI